MDPVEPLDSTLLDRADVRAAFEARDVGAVYRLLGKAGVALFVTKLSEIHLEICAAPPRLSGSRLGLMWGLSRS